MTHLGELYYNTCLSHMFMGKTTRVDAEAGENDFGPGERLLTKVFREAPKRMEVVDIFARIPGTAEVIRGDAEFVPKAA